MVACILLMQEAAAPKPKSKHPSLKTKPAQVVVVSAGGGVESVQQMANSLGEFAPRGSTITLVIP